MYDEKFLLHSLQRRMLETHCISLDDYFKIVEKNIDAAKNFENSLHINFSEFFRNPISFIVLAKIVLPIIIQKKIDFKQKEIRIWSAACAAGQEPYSLAMLLEDCKNGDIEKFNYRIFATDIHESLLKEAIKGKYSTSSLNNITLKRLEKWFIKHGDSYSIQPELKKNIDFSVFDLFNKQTNSPSASIFGDFDLVVCANLLFYYKPKYRKIILEKITNSLADGAYLLTGEAEREILMNDNYYEIFPQSAIFQLRKFKK